MALSVGERIAAARLRSGLKTVEAAAELTGLSRNFLYQIERIGNRPNAANPTLDTLETLALAYKCALGDFFESSESAGVEVVEIAEALRALPEQRRTAAARSIANLVLAIVGRNASSPRAARSA